jgi:hypothetical protein
MESSNTEYCGQCGGKFFQGSTHVCLPVVNIGIFAPMYVPPMPCPGCGTAYAVMTVDPLHPHDFATCEAYHRGFKDGQAFAKMQAEQEARHEQPGE